MIKIRLLCRKRPERTKPLLGMSSGFVVISSGLPSLHISFLHSKDTPAFRCMAKPLCCIPTKRYAAHRFPVMPHTNSAICCTPLSFPCNESLGTPKRFVLFLVTKIQILFHPSKDKTSAYFLSFISTFASGNFDVKLNYLTYGEIRIFLGRSQGLHQW